MLSKRTTYAPLAAIVALALSGTAMAAGQGDGAMPSSGAATEDQTQTRNQSQSGAQSQQGASQVQAGELIGTELTNASDETIGEINSVILDKDGEAAAVVVGVGGFLGMGEREAAISWDELTISDDGQKVTTNLTEEELRDLPEYQYSDEQNRGKAFRDEGYGASSPSTSPTGTGTE